MFFEKKIFLRVPIFRILLLNFSQKRDALTFKFWYEHQRGAEMGMLVVLDGAYLPSEGFWNLTKNDHFAEVLL